MKKVMILLALMILLVLTACEKPDKEGASSGMLNEHADPNSVMNN